ncbi:MAG TPA: lytic transglycosylase domain-containing protein [Vicinamibacteria bacterium]|nr:lytic transglycosylase domain-containing protein [Vicinamibacteria bacterium]
MDERRMHDRRERYEPRPLSIERRLAGRRKLVVGAGLLVTMTAVAPRALNYDGRAADIEVTAEEFRVPVFDKQALDALIAEAAATYGVSAELVRAVIQTESAFNPVAVSPVGALGLMQLMPVTAAYLGVADPLDPRQNVNGGVKYLSMLLDRFNGNVALALAGYNAGPTAVRRHKGIPPYRETRGYVRKIRALVADTHSAFTIPEPRRPKAKASARKAAARKAAARKASARKAAVRKASVRKASVRKATVRKASVPKAPVRSKAGSSAVRSTR